MTVPAVLTSADHERVQLEILALITQQTRRVPLPIFVCMAALSVIAAEHLPTWIPATWLAFAGCVLLVRSYMLRDLHSRPGRSASQKIATLVRWNLLSATVHASSLLVYPLLMEAERAFFTVLLLGLCSGAIATMAGNTRALLAFISPIIVSLTAMWAWSPGVYDPNSVERVISLLIVGYAAVIMRVGRDVNRSVTDAWGFRLRERDLNQQLTEALAKAEEAGRVKARFLTAASHDMRQPLAVINAVTATLGLRDHDARDKHALDVLDDATRELTAQIRTLIDTCRLDSATLKVSVQAVDLSALLQQHALEIALQVQAKGLGLALVCPPGVFVQTDPALLLRILRNLTGNAIKYTATGQITLRLASATDGVSVAVEDTGRGIASDQHVLVFDEFYQVAPGQDVDWAGLGLGLAIVKRLAMVLGIRVALRSELGQGAAFTLHLPK